ncbi:MAG: AEC family transporter [Defluviitaleaceae bacterium]|nr:AEC family transporter [Defluviitaleaceae bacterium]
MNIINDTVSAGLSGLLVNFALPSLIIMAMQMEFTPELLREGGLIFGIFVILHIILAALGILFCKILKIPRCRRGIILFCLTFGNVAFMGMPVIGSIYNDLGLFYTSMVNVVFCLLAPTMGLRQIKSGKIKEKEEIKGNKRKFKPNIAFLASILGMILFLSSVRLPIFLSNALTYTANLTTPLSMIMIGGLLAKNSIKSIKSLFDRGVIILSFIKLLVIPLVCLVIFRIFIDSEIVTGVMVYLIAMPAPALAAIFAEQHKTEPQYASGVVAVTTALSLITIPVISLFL